MRHMASVVLFVLVGGIIGTIRGFTVSPPVYPHQSWHELLPFVLLSYANYGMTFGMAVGIFRLAYRGKIDGSARGALVGGVVGPITGLVSGFAVFYLAWVAARYGSSYEGLGLV